MSEKIKIAIAGSTERTVTCAEPLRVDDRFEVIWVLTPAPKILGRKKELTENPLHDWSNKHAITSLLLERNIEDSVKNKVLQAATPDVLLVVDFGYLVPHWLLNLPKVAPLNVHPSNLPRWRGSSPGQFVLLYGEQQSAVTLMVMNEGLDTGPIVAQLPFAVNPAWTQKEYYQHSFELMRQQLADLIASFVSGERTAAPQPATSPTPVARRLTREDGYIEWDSLTQLMIGSTSVILNPLLVEASRSHSSPALLVSAACKAFFPWPGIWTTVHNQRLKILNCHVEGTQLMLDQVQLEGKQPTTWQHIKSQLL